MGGQKQSKDKFEDKELKTGFKLEDRKKLKASFIQILKLNVQDKNFEKTFQQSQFQIDHFKSLFSNDPELGQKLFKWMQSLQQNQAPITPYDLFDYCQYLFASTNNYFNPLFNQTSLTSQQLLFVLCNDINWQTFDINNNIKLEEVEKYLEHIFLMFGENDPKLNKSILENVFKYGETTYERFFQKMIDKMQYINKGIQDYFASKFLDRKKYLKCPEIIGKESIILTRAYQGFFYLGGIGAKNYDGFYQLFSSDHHGTSFQTLSFRIIGYTAPTLIIIKHLEKNEQTGKFKSHIFGGYNEEEWKEHLGYQGSTGNFLFTMKPEQDILYAYKGKGGQNFCYLNTKHIENSKYKVGLGFGGTNSFSDFRLWIDNRVESSSYVKPDDDAYDIGFLLDPKIYNLKIDTIEVYGLGTEQHLVEQAEYRAEQDRITQKMRKIDKKQLFDGAIGDMFMSELTKHKDQVNRDVEGNPRKQEEDEEDLYNEEAPNPYQQ